MVGRGLLGGRYQLGAALGSGGFATVFRARDRERDVDVAVKLVPPPLPGRRIDLLGARLRHELDVLRRIASRHVARVFDAGDDEHGVWLVLELVDGLPLTAAALGRPLLPHEVLRVARGLLEGLSAAHDAGVVHGDVKPTNVLVPRKGEALDGAKLIDFGLARVTARADVARELGLPARAEGGVYGTVSYMAPEVLAGGDVSAASDVYGAGLLLFELLGAGPLFPGETRRDRLAARVEREPEIESRVPPPLAAVLARMLARDPAARYRDASRALDDVLDLDTAPASSESPLSHPTPSVRPASSSLPSSASHGSALPGSASPTSAPRSIVPSSRIEAQTRWPSSAPRPSMPPPPRRLTTLPAQAADALRETLRFLDVPMLDALARRERGNPFGRIARAASLALRLELDAAAVLLEPLRAQSDVACAIGATLLAPRARRITRGRVDADRDDTWVSTVPPELGALLISLGVALGAGAQAARDVARAAEALARLEGGVSGADGETVARIELTAATLRVAIAAARARVGERGEGGEGGDGEGGEAGEGGDGGGGAGGAGLGVGLIAPLERIDAHRMPPLDRFVRAMCAAAAAEIPDESRAREELERASRVAAESGATLLEACSTVAWGRRLVDLPTRLDQGLEVLARAGTLLAHGDAPSLEHAAEQHQALGLVASGRFLEALPHLRAARAAAHGERDASLEVASASLLVLALLVVGDRAGAAEAVASLRDARSSAEATASLAWLATSLQRLTEGDRAGAEGALDEARARASGREAAAAEAWVLCEVLSVLFAAARGEGPPGAAPIAEIARTAEAHGFASFSWFDVLEKVIDRLVTEERGPMAQALAQISLRLGPASRRARERQTDAPPAPREGAG